MFRPNRIGTPHVLGEIGTHSVANWTPNSSAHFPADWGANVINATPTLDLGRVSLNWNGSEAIGASAQVALVHQFTVSPPLVGNVVGIECAGHFCFDAAIAGITVVPVIGKLNAAGAVLFDPVTFQDFPNLFQAKVINPTTGTYALSWKEQHTFWADSSGIPQGTLAVGVVMFAPAAGFSLTAFNMSSQVRQLNDQQDVSYRDTRK